jgi:hypothetical protein
MYSTHYSRSAYLYTDIKENKIFLIYKEIQKGSVAQSYMTNGLLMVKYLCISSYIRDPFLIYVCNRSHLNFLTYEENFLFFFTSDAV